MKRYELTNKDFMECLIREFVNNSLYMLHELNEKSIKVIYFINNNSKNIEVKYLDIFDVEKIPEKGLFYTKSNLFRLIINNPLYDDNFLEEFDEEFGFTYFKERAYLMETDAFVYYDVNKFIFEKIISNHLFELYKFATKYLYKDIISLMSNSQFVLYTKLFLNN